jgi:hypothetical protein
VAVEADANEAWEIAEEERYKELLEMVGLTGTPDDGLRVIEPGMTTTPAFEVRVNPGTMYVGGVRVETPDEIVYSNQDEWLDRAGDPDWRDPANAAGTEPNELVYLALREHEVGAVEDPVLREVALGGPDTAQRSRLVKRIKRLGVTAGDCAAAVKQATAVWAAQGLDFHERTGRLEPRARLKVGFTTTGGTTGPCDPVATGGYLDADNQLIRVEVTAWDQGAGTGKLLWGYDNSSFMYRATVMNAQLLQLVQRPPDDTHQPRAGDAIEVLRPAVELDGDAFVAAPTGAVVTLTKAYVPETQRIELPSPGLGSQFPVSTGATPPYFVRVWKQELAFTAGAPVTLGTSGVTVTIDSAGRPVFLGSSWCFAVRPSTSDAVYPERFRQAGQPVSAPRLWACPLAVVHWDAGVLNVLDDCRAPFDDLVTLTKRPIGTGGCDCTVCVTPTSHATRQLTIQAAVDQVAETGGTVCLAPGLYELEETVRIENARGVRLRGQGWRTELAQSALSAAIEVTDSVGIAIERLTVRGLPFSGGGSNALVGIVAPKGIDGAGIALTNSAGVDVTECAILHAPVPDPERLQDPDLGLIADIAASGRGVGIALDAVAFGHRFSRNMIAARNGIGPSSRGEGDDRPPGAYVAAGRLLVEDNVIACNRFGVRLQGSAMLVDTSRIRGNSIYGCRNGAGVEVLGRTGLPDKRLLRDAVRLAGSTARPDPACGLDIVGNVIRTASDGVVSSVDGTRVVGNRIRTVGEATPGRGVALVRTDGVDTLDTADVRENRIVGIRGQGVLLDTAIGACTVESNAVQHVLSAGIAVAPDGSARRLVVAANDVDGVEPPNPAEPNAVSGILAQVVLDLVVDGNSVERLGATVGREIAFERTGIKLIATTTARVSGNRIESFGSGEFGGDAVGIDVLAPWDRLLVSGNTVRRRAMATSDSDGRFIAIRIRRARGERVEEREGDLTWIEVETIDVEGPITELEEELLDVGFAITAFNVIPVPAPEEAAVRTGVVRARMRARTSGGGAELGGTSLFNPALIAGAERIDLVPGGRGIVDAAGNILDAETRLEGTPPSGACMEIDGAGPCAVTHNQCFVSETSVAIAVLRVDATSVIASANHLQGTVESLRMDNVGATAYTVLGNIAPGGISRNPGGVDQRWLDLNAV